MVIQFHYMQLYAGVAELADALDLGSSAIRRGSSNLFARTIIPAEQKENAAPNTDVTMSGHYP